MKTGAIIADKIISTKQVEISNKQARIATENLTKGLTLFEIDLMKKTIRKATFDEGIVNMNGTISRKVMVKENHLYMEALNIKNAKRRVLQKYKINVTNS
jgi:hypothetical protein